MQATFFVQVKTLHSKYWDPEKVTGIRAVKLTQKRPDKPEGIVIKIAIDVPDDYFDAPAVIINMPTQQLQAAIAETQAWTS